MSRGAVSAVELLAVAIIIGLLLWAADIAAPRLVPKIASSVQTSGIPPAHEPCTLPTEHEQMVVILYWRDGKLKQRCMFVGAHGTYSKPRKVPTT